jgi:hypothetical protein
VVSGLRDSAKIEVVDPELKKSMEVVPPVVPPVEGEDGAADKN